MQIEGVKLKSFFPGRVKLRVEAIEGDEQFARNVQDDLAALEGIKFVEADPERGTLMIKYDKKRLLQPDCAQALLAVLEGHFPSIDFDRIKGWLNPEN
jgi:hypothetical protein